MSTAQQFFGSTKPPSDRPRNDFLGHGDHDCTILEVRCWNGDKGRTYGVDFLVDSSTTLPVEPGKMTIRSQVYCVEKKPERANYTSDADRLVDLLCKIEGVPTDRENSARLSEAMLFTAAEIPAYRKPDGSVGGGQLDRQPLRGVRVKLKGNPPKAGKTYVVMIPTSVPQQPADVATRRAWLDSVLPLGATPPVQQNAFVPPPAAPASTYGQQSVPPAPPGWQYNAAGQLVPQVAPPTPVVHAPPPGYPPAPPGWQYNAAGQLVPASSGLLG